jgi:zinc protease
MKNALIVLLLLCSNIVFYTPQLSAQYKPITFIEDSLPNGLKYILHIDKSAPVIATVMYYKVGSRNEDPARTGFAHFFEHLMFEATKDIPRAKIPEYVESAGGSLNAFTSLDQTVYHFKMGSNMLPLALWIEAQRVRDLQVNSIGVETQRGVVKEERKNRYDNTPYGTMREKMYAKLFKGTPYEWMPIGSAQHIDQAEIKEFVEFYNTYYQPNNAVLVISGDFNPDQAKQLVKEYFGVFKKGAVPPATKVSLQPLKDNYTEKVEDPKAQLPAVFIGYHGPNAGTPDYYAMQMLTTILGTGESSRLYKRLVSQDQISVFSGMSHSAHQYVGSIMFQGYANPGGDLEKIQKTIMEEVQSIVENGVTDAELQKAKNIKEAQFIQGKTGVLEKALELAEFSAYYNNPKLINTEISLFTKVTKADIQRVAKQYLGKDVKSVALQYVPKSK